MTFRGWYSPPNGITTSVVLGDFDLNFQGQIRNADISKTVRAGVKMRDITFKDIRYRIATLRMLYSVTFT